MTNISVGTHGRGIPNTNLPNENKVHRPTTWVNSLRVISKACIAECPTDPRADLARRYIWKYGTQRASI